jgi:hypothetical protein
MQPRIPARRALRREVGLDRNNAATVYPNIQVLARRSVRELCSSYYQVHGSMGPVATRKAESCVRTGVAAT